MARCLEILGIVCAVIGIPTLIVCLFSTPDHGYGCSCGYEEELGPCPYTNVTHDEPFEDDSDYWGV